MGTHTVTVEGTGDAFACSEDRNVLECMERAGLHAVDVGCRRGGCGVCRVQVVGGTFNALKMSRAHVTADDIEHGVVLSCRISATSDLVVHPLGLRPPPQHHATHEAPTAPAATN
jgi:ferredoxin